MALEGATVSAIGPPRPDTAGSLGGSDQEPSAGTVRPPSCTPVAAAGEGAVSASTRAPLYRRATYRRTSTRADPGGSSSTTTTCRRPSGARSEVTVRSGCGAALAPGQLTLARSARSPTSALVSSSAYHSGRTLRAPAESRSGVGAQSCE